MKYIPLVTLLAAIAVVPVVSGQNPSGAMEEARENAMANKARANASRRQQGGGAMQNQARQRNFNAGAVRTDRVMAGRAGAGRNRTFQGTAPATRPNVNRAVTGDGSAQVWNGARSGRFEGRQGSRRFENGDGSQRFQNAEGVRSYRNFNRRNRGSEFNATTGDFRENRRGRGNGLGRNRGGGIDGNGRGDLDGSGTAVYQGNAGNESTQLEGRRGGRHQRFHDRHEGDPNFRQIHRRWHRQRQDRSWWTNRYNRFALFGGGYYYFNSGYWYPAYGYDSSYSTYAYDAPIYGYNGLEPGDVIARVQTELQRLGYDPGPVDGDFGPGTRSAIIAFQQDNGLPRTGEIDENTLSALGLE